MPSRVTFSKTMERLLYAGVASIVGMLHPSLSLSQETSAQVIFQQLSEAVEKVVYCRYIAASGAPTLLPAAGNLIIWLQSDASFPRYIVKDDDKSDHGIYAVSLSSGHEKMGYQNVLIISERHSKVEIYLGRSEVSDVEYVVEALHDLNNAPLRYPNSDEWYIDRVTGDLQERVVFEEPEQRCDAVDAAFWKPIVQGTIDRQITEAIEMFRENDARYKARKSAVKF